MLDEQTRVLRLQKERLDKEQGTLDEEQRLGLSHLRLRVGPYSSTLYLITNWCESPTRKRMSR